MNKQKSKAAQFIELITFDEVYNYYIIENHSKRQCYDYFNTTERIFRTFLEFYNLTKPRNLVKQLSDQTKLEKYGNVNYNNHEKYKQTCLEKFGTSSALADKEIHKRTIERQKELYGGTGFECISVEKRTAIAKKANKTMWDKYHTDEDFAKAYQDSQNKTKRMNKSFNTSVKEKQLLEELIITYGKDDVYTQYCIDSRYPFSCDFYIKSQDLFIELNAHWTHGKHPFNINNPEDIKILNCWKEKAKTSEFYKNAIETWTIRDVDKLNYLLKNNLNFKLIYDNLEVTLDDYKY